MKRVLLVLVSMVSAIVLSACSKEAEQICYVCNESCPESASFCQNCGAELSINSEEVVQEYEEEIVDYSILDSGYCNQNISWEIRSNGTLYIGGRGAVPSYEDMYRNLAPWRESPLVSEITDVIIGDDITGLGENVFYRLTLNTLYVGKNVRVFEHDFNYFHAENIYISKSLKDICPLLWEAMAEKERDYPITVYYEGTEKEWNQAVSGRSHDFQNVTICFDYNYNN